MSAQHTSGPWTVYEPVEGATYGISGEDGTAVVFWGETTSNGINRIEDARLIAAAPDGLDAAREALIALVAAPDSMAVQIARQKLRAFITKATGATS